MLSRPLQFYRIVESDPPTLWDVTSLQGRGRPLRNPTPEALRRWSGISVFETLAQARAQRRKFPHLGEFIAELHLPPESDIRCERTSPTPGHWTLWAPPELLIATVTVVTSAEAGA